VFRIVHRIDIGNISSKELASWLDERFGTEQAEGKSTFTVRDTAAEVAISHESWMRKWGDKFRRHCPKSLGKSLFYICRESESYPNKNFLSRIYLNYGWPLFFERFPHGQIWLCEISIEWFEKLWEKHRLLATEIKHDWEADGIYLPHEFSGLQAENFPLAALSTMSCGIYPLILCDYVNTFTHLTLIYIPDQAFTYSQMTESGTLYQETLWKFHHVLDDQWTFDGSRGPKSKVSEQSFSPIEQLTYFDWFIDQVSQRMSDIIAISDPITREQIGMTINRAICDAHLCITSELPYMSKVFFFGCLDKLANLMTLMRAFEESKDTKAWKRLVSADFLGGDVLDVMGTIPGNIGKCLCRIVKFFLNEVETDSLSPEYLRALRNTHHGYKLSGEMFERRLIKTSPEFDNSVTLIVTPLVLFFLSKQWDVIID